MMFIARAMNIRSFVPVAVLMLEPNQILQLRFGESNTEA